MKTFNRWLSENYPMDESMKQWAPWLVGGMLGLPFAAYNMKHKHDAPHQATPAVSRSVDAPAQPPPPPAAKPAPAQVPAKPAVNVDDLRGAAKGKNSLDEPGADKPYGEKSYKKPETEYPEKELPPTRGVQPPEEKPDIGTIDADVEVTQDTSPLAAEEKAVLMGRPIVGRKNNDYYTMGGSPIRVDGRTRDLNLSYKAAYTQALGRLVRNLGSSNVHLRRDRPVKVYVKHGYVFVIVKVPMKGLSPHYEESSIPDRSFSSFVKNQRMKME